MKLEDFINVNLLINNRVFDHLEKCGLFSDLWFGFSSSQSTAYLFMVTTDRITRAFNRSASTRAVTIDKSKSFNRVWPGFGSVMAFSQIQTTSSGSGWEVYTKTSSYLGPTLLGVFQAFFSTVIR